MKALVTGGCGYVGSHLVAALHAAGDELLVLDDLSTGHRDVLPPRVALEVQKLGRDGEGVRAAIEAFRPDVTFHFAGASQVAESMRDPGKYWQENVVGSLMLIDALLRVECKSLVFSSTAATYGVPTRLPLDEEHPRSPVNPYGHTKLAVETALRDHAPLGLRSVSLRYFNAAGAGAGLRERHDPETHLCPIIADVALGRRESITVYGTDYDTEDGTAVRDYVHVEDLVRAHVAAADYLQSHPGAHAMNLGTGTGHSVRQVIGAFEAESGFRIRTELGPRRPGDPPTLVASFAKAKRELGWTPRLDLRRIARDALQSRT